MRRCAFVTGGSGFLGSFVVRELLEAEFDEVVVLMRGHDAEAAAARLRALWWERPELAREIGKRVRAVCGDVCRERLGLEACEHDALAREVTHIVHAAAEIGVNETARRFGDVNVNGTLNVLLFADACRRQGGLQRFVHVSTAYVAGMREGLVREDELVDTGFNSLYEQSKFGAEQLVRDAMPRISACIVRPAQIVGDSVTGFAATFNTLYYPLKLYLKGQLPVVPVSAGQKLNMVPVDYVARLVVRALADSQAPGKTFHAVVPAEDQPTVGEMLAFVRTWAIDNLGYDPGAPLCIPMAFAAGAGRRRNMAQTSAPKRKGFLNHTGRTVFQQMLVRLSSARNTLTYYDVTRDGVLATDAADAKDAILKVAGALQARGIGPDDRVVLVGVNSTRYFIADAAVGLVGATSVPLYYTSPVADIVELARQWGEAGVRRHARLGRRPVRPAWHPDGVAA